MYMLSGTVSRPIRAGACQETLEEGHGACSTASHVQNLEPVSPPCEQSVPDQSCGGAEHGRIPAASCRGRPCPAAACGRGWE